MLEFEARRKKVFEQMKDNSVAIFFSGVSKIASEDEMLPYVTNKNFFYLTNIKQEHSVLMLIKSLGEKKTYLFIDPYSELKEKWTGKRLTVDKAMLLSDIKNVYTTDTFETMLKLALANDNNQYGDIDCVYLDLTSPEQKIDDGQYINDFSLKLKLDFNDKEIVDSYPMMRDLRMVKSSTEIEYIIKAIDKTNSGISLLVSQLNGGIVEHELADVFEMYGRSHDRAPLAFSTIIAGGKNATCLHYPTQDDVIKQDDLVLFDLGYSYNGYSADISRTSQ